MKEPMIYIVDDDTFFSKMIEKSLNRHFSIKSFEKAEDAISALSDEKPSILLLDIELPGMNGINAIKEIKEISPDTVIMMLTGNKDINLIVSAIKNGASDYMVKPIDANTLVAKINKELKHIKIKSELCQMQELFLKEKIPYIIGESEQISEVMAVVKKVTESKDTSVLISGEIGTGKEFIARIIHNRSPNSNGPFVPINCAAIQESMFESELFGYVKGVFSGAFSSGKIGLAERAENGTLFLDEISELPLSSQAKLLRFLETKEYYQVGGTKKCQAHIRIISASNKNLEKLIENKAFREDLYYRLAVVKIRVPALNNRRDDILPIARHFLSEFNDKFSKKDKCFSAQAEHALESFHWKGNIIELRNCVERGVLISSGNEIQTQDLGIHNKDQKRDMNGVENGLPEISSNGIDCNEILHTIEMHYLKSALKLSNGNETKAAKFLKMSRDKFRYRRAKLGIP